MARAPAAAARAARRLGRRHGGDGRRGRPARARGRGPARAARAGAPDGEAATVAGVVAPARCRSSRRARRWRSRTWGCRPGAGGSSSTSARPRASPATSPPGRATSVRPRSSSPATRPVLATPPGRQGDARPRPCALRPGLPSGPARSRPPTRRSQDAVELAAATGLPFWVKGVLRADDAVLAVEAGAAGVVVSNHGGRQLDGAVATADGAAEVVDGRRRPGRGARRRRRAQRARRASPPWPSAPTPSCSAGRCCGPWRSAAPTACRDAARAGCAARWLEVLRLCGLASPRQVRADLLAVAAGVDAPRQLSRRTPRTTCCGCRPRPRPRSATTATTTGSTT